MRVLYNRGYGTRLKLVYFISNAYCGLHEVRFLLCTILENYYISQPWAFLWLSLMIGFRVSHVLYLAGNHWENFWINWNKSCQNLGEKKFVAAHQGLNLKVRFERQNEYKRAKICVVENLVWTLKVFLSESSSYNLCSEWTSQRNDLSLLILIWCDTVQSELKTLTDANTR